MVSCVGETVTGVPLVTGMVELSTLLLINPVPLLNVAVSCVEFPLTIGFGVAMKLAMIGAGITLTVAELTDAVAPAALVTVRVKVVLLVRDPVDTTEPLPTVPTPLLTMPAPLEKLGNNRIELPLVAVVTDGIRLAATGAGTAVTVKGAEIDVPAGLVTVKMKVVVVFTPGTKSGPPWAGFALITLPFTLFVTTPVAPALNVGMLRVTVALALSVTKAGDPLNNPPVKIGGSTACTVALAVTVLPLAPATVSV